MATKSVLKTIHIKKRRSASALVDALEHANKKGRKEVILQRPHSTASRDEIRKMFGGSDDRIQNR